MSKEEYFDKGRKSKFFDTETEEQFKKDLQEEIEEEVEKQNQSINNYKTIGISNFSTLF